MFCDIMRNKSMSFLYWIKTTVSIWCILYIASQCTKQGCNLRKYSISKVIFFIRQCLFSIRSHNVWGSSRVIDGVLLAGSWVCIPLNMIDGINNGWHGKHFIFSLMSRSKLVKTRKRYLCPNFGREVTNSCLLSVHVLYSFHSHSTSKMPWCSTVCVLESVSCNNGNLIRYSDFKHCIVH